MSLLEIRNQLGVSKNSAAKMVGVTVKTYAKYENGEIDDSSPKYQEMLQRLRSFLTKKAINPAEDDFGSIIENGVYYVDKSLFIEELLRSKASPVLFTRPRRFGKSLNLSMLRYFFDLNNDSKHLFKGLKIASNEELVKEHMNAYPVIYLTLKEVQGKTYQKMEEELRSQIAISLSPYSHLLDEEGISDSFKERLALFSDKKETDVDAAGFLLEFSSRFYSIYKKKAVIIVDEYDVPLQKANENGYYDDALFLINGLLSAGVKSNPNVFLAVLGGCLKISKESMFTGLNNVKEFSVLDNQFSSYFGFEEEEVDALLSYYGLKGEKQNIKEFYDGYRFGKSRIYCPFDVMNYVYDCINHNAMDDEGPRSYWINSGSNAALYFLLSKPSAKTKDEIAALMEGKTLEKELDFELTYRTLASTPDNIYSLMVLLGYLTVIERKGRACVVALPNKEILDIFKKHIEVFMEQVYLEARAEKGSIFDALFAGDVKKATSILSEALWKSVGIHDYARSEKDKESFYHGFLLGLLLAQNDEDEYEVISNKEAGLGLVDIAILDYANAKGIIIEIKVGSAMEELSLEAKSQIEEKAYRAIFPSHYEVSEYAVTFFKKLCKVSLLSA